MNNANAKDFISHFFLKNKLKVITAYDSSSHLVSLQLFIRVGSAFEAEKEAGYSHLTEHLVFKSTQNYPQNSLMEKAALFGTTLNAYTEYESTCYYITLPAEYIDEGLEMLSEIAFFANFSDSDFHTEKGVVIEELKQIENDPEDSFIENIPALVMSGSPYNKLIIGNLANLKKATPDELRAFYQKYYTPENMFLVISGLYEPESIAERVSRLFDPAFSPGYPALPKRKKVVTTYKNKGSAPLFYSKNISTDLLAFVLPELPDTHPQSTALAVVIKAFAMGHNSQLYKRLFIEEKLASQIKVHSISGIYSGVTIIMVHPYAGADKQEIVKVFCSEFAALQVNGISAEVLYQTQQELLIYSEYTYEFMETLAQNIGSEEVLGDYQRFYSYADDIKSITKSDITALIKEHYHFANLTIISAGKKPVSLNLDYDAFCSSVTPAIDESKDEKPSPKPAYQRQKVVLPVTGKELTLWQKTYENGFTVLVKKVKDKSICGVSLSLKVSQLDENKDILGTNQVTSSMLLYGNFRRDYQQCLQFCAFHGIPFSVSNSKETTKIRLKCFLPDLYLALEYMSDVLYSPEFPKPHFKNIKKAFLNNISKIKDYPQSEAGHLFRKLIFGEHSNLVSKNGSRKALNKLSWADMLSWYAKKLSVAPATLCIVGDIDIDETLTKVMNLFVRKHKTPPTYLKPIIADPFVPQSPKTAVRKRDLNQSIINLGGYCMTSADRHRATAMNVLSQIIGGDINSRMFTALREEHGIAYSADFDFDVLHDLGYYHYSAIVDKKAEKKAIELIHNIQNDLKKYGALPHELKAAKAYLIGQRKIDEESTLTQAQILSTLLALGYDHDYYLSREERINKVTNDDIIEIMNLYFDQNQQFLHTLH
ncbi:MAG: insulinase family protein [Candidatus Cloacimonetes bacterium]|nr:insulinase family protein [Candidatus Cloacimonadota bacterium]